MKMKPTQFKDLSIGDTFDFISPNIGYNSFFDRCKKTGSRSYVALEGKLKDMTLKVGSIKADVYHVSNSTDEA